MSKTPESYIDRAAQMRKRAKSVENPDAKREFMDAANRLERQAARAVRRVGKRVRPRQRRQVL